MADLDQAALGARAEAMIKQLAPISAEPDRLVRLFLSGEHRRAADIAAQWMREAGLTVTEDALGTLRGRVGEGPRLLIGSHLDSVIDAGNYDGPLGVIAGILAVGHFAGKPPLPIDVLAFGDEEGSRFPSALSSSAACAGLFEAGTLALADRNGVTFADALKAYGKNPADIPQAAYKRGEALGYVEAHIEQGPRLEAANQPLGVVTGIVGQSRWRVIVTGEAGHAGTVPMTMRRDALAGAAEMMVEVEWIGRAHDNMVATVGTIEAKPGAGNIIPGRVELHRRLALHGQWRAQSRRTGNRNRSARDRGCGASSMWPSSISTTWPRRHATRVCRTGSPPPSAISVCARCACRRAPATTRK